MNTGVYNKNEEEGGRRIQVVVRRPLYLAGKLSSGSRGEQIDTTNENLITWCKNFAHWALKSQICFKSEWDEWKSSICGAIQIASATYAEQNPLSLSAGFHNSETAT